MIFATSQSFRQVLAASLMLTLFVQVAQADELKVKISEIQNPDLVQILPTVIDGLNADIVKVGNLPEFSVRAELDDDTYTAEEKEKLSEVRRDILDKTVTGLIVGTSEQPLLVTDEKLMKAGNESGGDELQLNVFPKRKSVKERIAAIIGFLNENILRSTYRAGKSFVSESKSTKGFREFGLSVVFRGEFQVGVGKVNVMRTLARGLDIGYDVKSKELVIRTVKRHEKMDGGTAMALGPKMELRAYRANLDIEEHLSKDGHVHGKTWYPPAPPLLTFASESFPGYHSVGTALAFNVFDVFVPTYLFNTVNEFDADYHVTRVSLSPLNYVRLSVAAVRNRLVGPRPSANQCRAIFSRAY